MKLWDVLKLIGHEYRYEKREWILSIVLQCMIYISVFFLFTVAGDLDKVLGTYISPLYPNGFEFRLNGFHETDIPTLNQMGFHDIIIFNDREEGLGVVDDLSGIWIYKFQAVFAGKDIWNEELDEILSIMFFCQITFVAIGIAMFLIMMNNLSNSITMKLTRRTQYIMMLKNLGCPDMICKEIYYGFFFFRNIIALLLAATCNGLLFYFLNEYMMQHMYINIPFPQFHWVLIGVLCILSMILMWLSFVKQWRQIDEGKR